ncbi:MAG: right-handed parallel beta-helix repeat-containing protein [Planctomycetota bacterium]
MKSNAGGCNSVTLEVPNRCARLICLCLAVVCGLSLAWARADAPEKQVWTDAPQKSQPSQIGPQNQPIEVGRYQKTLYVSRTTGSDRSGDGSSQRPFKSINHAISQISDADPNSRHAILVAAGTYDDATLHMREYVDLYGGFGPRHWRHDIFAHRTILHGRRSRRVVEAPDHARLDGFVITGGSSQGHGAGILCHRTSPTITNNVITGNTTLEPVGFVHDPNRRRHVGNDGGGIACVDGANPLIAHNIIHGNSTQVGNGAGIACRDDACPKIVYNVIWGNETGLKDVRDTRSSNAGGIFCFAGALPIINNNLIANNHAAGGSDAGGIYCEYNCSPQVRFNYVLGNYSEDDGGAFEIMKSSQPRIISNIFAGNWTDGGGGAIRLSDQGLARIANNVIARNTACGTGGGVACTNAWMILENNTIVDNNSEDVGGVFYENQDWPHLMPPLLTRNIVWGNAGEQIDDKYLQADVNFNIVQGGYCAPGNVDTDPKFENDGFSVGICVMTYDQNTFLTTMLVTDRQLVPDSLAGRVIRVAYNWSIVKANTDKELIAWGELLEYKGDFEILPTYRLQSGSVCADKGVQTLQ